MGNRCAGGVNDSGRPNCARVVCDPGAMIRIFSSRKGGIVAENIRKPEAVKFADTCALGNRLPILQSRRASVTRLSFRDGTMEVG